MATPIQHTSQFIPTDLGVLERNLAATQQRADSAVQGLLQADAQFGSTIAANQDLEAKQNVIKNFRDRSKEVLQRYGGDPAKASKELAREVVKAGNDPFWQVNKAKQNAVNQYNQMKAKLGSNFIEGKNPATIPVYNEETGYTSPEEFSPVVYNAQDLKKSLDETFSPRLNKLYQTALSKATNAEGYLETDVFRGVMQENLPELQQEMYDQLRTEASMVDQYGDNQLKQLAENTANSYSLGMTRKFMRDLEFDAGGAGEEVQPGTFFTEIGGVSTDETENRLAGSTEKLLGFNEKLDEISSNLVGLATTEESGAKMSEIDKRNLKNYQEQMTRYQKKRDNFLKNVSEEYPIYNYLTKEEGLSPEEAVARTEKVEQKRIDTGVFKGIQLPYDIDEIKPKLEREFTGIAANNTDILVEKDDGIQKVNTGFLGLGDKATVAEVLTDKDFEPIDIGMDFTRGEFVVTDAVEGEGHQRFRIPFDAVKNQAVKEALNSVNTFVDAYSGKVGPTTEILGSHSNPKYLTVSDYDNINNDMVSNVYKIVGSEDGQYVLSPEPVRIQDAISDVTNNIFDYYGGQGEYQPPKRKKVTQ